MIIKKTIKSFLLYTANTPPIHQFLLSRLKQTVTVLMYHGIVPDDEPFHAWTLVRSSNFIKQIQYLKEHFHIITLDTALSPRIYEMSPRPKAVITFDDGMRNNLTEAFPILERFQVPAAIYISTEAVQSGKIPWWGRLQKSIQSKKTTGLNLMDLGLGIYDFHAHRTRPKQWEVISQLMVCLKNLNPSQRAHALSVIFQRLDIREENDENDPVFAPLRPEDIKRLSSSPLITIGSHTHCHSNLTQLTASEIKYSMKRSLVLLNDWTDKAIHHFSYPFGYYNSLVTGIVKQLGFKTAVTTNNGRWNLKSNSLEIPRIGIGGYDNLKLFKANACGMLEYINLIRQRLLSFAGK